MGVILPTPVIPVPPQSGSLVTNAVNYFTDPTSWPSGDIVMSCLKFSFLYRSRADDCWYRTDDITGGIGEVTSADADFLSAKVDGGGSIGTPSTLTLEFLDCDGRFENYGESIMVKGTIISVGMWCGNTEWNGTVPFGVYIIQSVDIQDGLWTIVAEDIRSVMQGIDIKGWSFASGGNVVTAMQSLLTSKDVPHSLTTQSVTIAKAFTSPSMDLWSMCRYALSYASGKPYIDRNGQIKMHSASQIVLNVHYSEIISGPDKTDDKRYNLINVYDGTRVEMVDFRTTTAEEAVAYDYDNLFINDVSSGAYYHNYMDEDVIKQMYEVTFVKSVFDHEWNVGDNIKIYLNESESEYITGKIRDVSWEFVNASEGESGTLIYTIKFTAGSAPTPNITIATLSTTPSDVLGESGVVAVNELIGQSTGNPRLAFESANPISNQYFKVFECDFSTINTWERWCLEFKIYAGWTAGTMMAEYHVTLTSGSTAGQLTGATCECAIYSGSSDVAYNDVKLVYSNTDKKAQIWVYITTSQTQYVVEKLISSARNGTAPFTTDAWEISYTSASALPSGYTSVTTSLLNHYVHITGNSGSATKLQTARTIDGVSFNGTAAIIHYGTCATAAATAAKTVACTGFALVTGAFILVKFTVTNTASSPTLNVNSTGAKSIYYRGAAISAGYLAANRTYLFCYDGTTYNLVGDLDTNTNTDIKVRQTTLSSDNVYRSLLLSYVVNTTTGNTDNLVYRSTKLYFNDSTGALTVPTVNGQKLTHNGANYRRAIASGQNLNTAWTAIRLTFGDILESNTLSAFTVDTNSITIVTPGVYMITISLGLNGLGEGRAMQCVITRNGNWLATARSTGVEYSSGCDTTVCITLAANDFIQFLMNGASTIPVTISSDSESFFNITLIRET